MPIRTRSSQNECNGVSAPSGNARCERQAKKKDHESDTSGIEDILRDIDIRDIKPTHHRIGKLHEIKSRPLKLALQNVKEKERIMSNLYKLKKIGPHGLSFTDDFTVNERRKIKKMHESAKKKNSGCDDNFVWRVRGSPRTSLRLVKIPRKNNRQSLTSLTSCDSWPEDDL